MNSNQQQDAQKNAWALTVRVAGSISRVKGDALAKGREHVAGRGRWVRREAKEG